MQSKTGQPLSHLKLSGTFVYTFQNNNVGLSHTQMSAIQEPRLGEVLNILAVVAILVLVVDRTLNLSLKPRSFEMLENIFKWFWPI